MSVAIARSPIPAILPGLALSFGLAGGALAIRSLPGMGAFSPAILAILLGIGARQMIGLPAGLRPGLGFTMRTLLRVAVMLLGLQITLGQVAALGLPALLAVAGGLLGCFTGTVWLGARLGVERRLARLIAIGTSVCGASAVVAGNSVIGGDDEDVAYALAAVTLFGTIAMLATPALAVVLHIDPVLAGMWTGASIHEVAQVVGAASQLGEPAMQAATVAKMARILMLAPLVLGLAATAPREERHQAKLPMPWFVFGFLGLAALASLVTVPAPVVVGCGTVSAFLLAAALGAMGFGVDLAAIRRKGLRPAILALSSWLLIGGLSLGLLSL